MYVIVSSEPFACGNSSLGIVCGNGDGGGGDGGGVGGVGVGVGVWVWVCGTHNT